MSFAKIAGCRPARVRWFVVAGVPATTPFGNGLGEPGVEVVGAGDARVGGEGARGHVVRDLHVEAAVGGEELGLAVAPDVVGRADAGRPKLSLQRVVAGDGGARRPTSPMRSVALEAGGEVLAALELLAVPADAGAEGQLLADLQVSWSEEAQVLLRGVAAGAEVGAA